jgi:hypothetical protein
MKSYHQCKLQRPFSKKLDPHAYLIQKKGGSTLEEAIKWVPVKEARPGKVLNDSWKIVEVYSLGIRKVTVNPDKTLTIREYLL